MHNKAFKLFATLTRTSGIPPQLAPGFAILARSALHASRRLTGLYGPPHLIKLFRS